MVKNIFKNTSKKYIFTLPADKTLTVPLPHITLESTLD